MFIRFREHIRTEHNADSHMTSAQFLQSLAASGILYRYGFLGNVSMVSLGMYLWLPWEYIYNKYQTYISTMYHWTHTHACHVRMLATRMHIKMEPSQKHYREIKQMYIKPTMKCECSVMIFEICMYISLWRQICYKCSDTLYCTKLQLTAKLVIMCIIKENTIIDLCTYNARNCIK